MCCYKEKFFKSIFVCLKKIESFIQKFDFKHDGKLGYQIGSLEHRGRINESHQERINVIFKGVNFIENIREITHFSFCEKVLKKIFKDLMLRIDSFKQSNVLKEVKSNSSNVDFTSVHNCSTK